MDSKIFKYIKILLYVLLGLGLAVFVYFLVTTISYRQPSDEFPLGTVGQAMGAGVMLWYAYIVFGIGIVVALIFPLINIIKNPKGASRSLIGLGIMVLIILISYFMSSTAPVPNSAGGFFTEPFPLRLADIGLYSGYIMLVLAFLAIIAGEIKSAFKK